MTRPHPAHLSRGQQSLREEWPLWLQDSKFIHQLCQRRPRSPDKRLKRNWVFPMKQTPGAECERPWTATEVRVVTRETEQQDAGAARVLSLRGGRLDAGPMTGREGSQHCSGWESVTRALTEGPGTVRFSGSRSRLSPPSM